MHKEIIKFWGKFLFIFPYGCIKNLKIRSKRAKLGNQNYPGHGEDFILRETLT